MKRLWMLCGFLSYVAAAQTIQSTPPNAPSTTGFIQQAITENFSHLGIVGKDQILLKENRDTLRRLNGMQAPAVPGQLPAPTTTTTGQLPAASVPDTIRPATDTAALPKSPIFGHDYFRNKNIRIFERTIEGQASNNYVIGVNDQIAINIWGYSSFSGSYTVDNTGAIMPEGVGKIYVKGLTLEKARQLIRSRFASYLDIPNSQIEITIIHSRIISVHIVGEVFHPGTYSIPALNSAFNALVAAGGPTDKGSVREIFVRRNGQTVRSLDVYQFLLNPSANVDLFLENNDYIFVPALSRIVTISGEVNRPYKYEFKEGEDLLTLINYAGGLTPLAYTKTIKIKRYSGNQVQLLDVNLDSLMRVKGRFLLQNGDEVHISSIGAELTRFVRASGAVVQPGDYAYSEGMRITDLLLKAHGLKSTAVTERAQVVRKNADLSTSIIHFSPAAVLSDPSSSDNLELKPQDEVVFYDRKNMVDTFTVTISGAVRMPGKYPYSSGMTLADLILTAGGLRIEAANMRVEVSRYPQEGVSEGPRVVHTSTIGKDLSLGTPTFALQPFDYVFVRSSAITEQMTVTLKGEVMYPGSYALTSKTQRIVDLIQQAGGLTPWADANQATLNRTADNRGIVFMDLEKALKKPDSRYNLLLRPGDEITIPLINDIVTISGMINYPYKDSLGFLNAPFKEGKRAKWYIKKYGLGFADGAKRARTYVAQPGGTVEGPRRLGFVRIYPKVQKGAYIVVPYLETTSAADSLQVQAKAQTQPVDWNRLIESAMIKITGLLTLYLLITRINF
ncbi:MAG: SLBB domain-containing protein [Chitinophagales bacterium]|nr:SLBB domain-containing protein [Chitinophagales bacterium]MDW8427877.1 SLBB domain-containing protein [Chitinophagales bacterium]